MRSKCLSAASVFTFLVNHADDTCDVRADPRQVSPAFSFMPMPQSPSLSSPSLASTTPDSSRLALGGFALAVIITIVLKLITMNQPIARDVMLYTVIGHEMFEGRELYTDLFEHKPPLFLTVFGVANLVAGYGKPAILLLNLLCALATLTGIYSAAKHLGKSPWAGAFAALCWALVSNDVNMHAHQPMPECFINACMAWAFALFLKLDSKRMHLGLCLLIGTLLMIASQVKQPVVLLAGLWSVVHLFCGAVGPGERKRRILQIIAIGSVGAATWAGMFVYFTAVGRGKMFNDALFTYNKFYAGFEDPNGGFIYGLKVMWWNFNNGLLPRRLFPSILLMMLPLFVASLIAAPLGLKRGAFRSWAMWVMYFAGTFFIVTSPGRGYFHYYLIYLPVFIAGGAGLFAVLDGKFSASSAKRIKQVVAVVSLLALAVSCVWQLTSSETVWARTGYGAHYTTMERLSAQIDEVLLPEETLYVWDYQPGFYVLPQRKPPAGVFYNAHALKGPLVDELTGRVMRMLESKPPQVIIIHEDELVKMKEPGVKMHPVYEWIRTNTQQVALADSGPFVVCVRKDGPLEGRIKEGKTGPMWRKLVAMPGN